MGHLFFTCSLARYVWIVVKYCFGLSAVPCSSQEVLNDWIASFSLSGQKLGIAAFLWILWETRSNACF